MQPYLQVLTILSRQRVSVPIHPRENDMKVDFRFRGIEASEALKEHFRRRVAFHLSRFGAEVSRVVIRIADINGPKGGLDKQCQLMVTGPRLGSVTLDDISGDVVSAGDMAIERIGRTISRELERQRTSQRRTGWVRRFKQRLAAFSGPTLAAED